MATDSAVKSVTNTLTGTTPDTITITQLWPAVEVTNHDTTTPLYVSMDATTSPTAAAAAADNLTVVPPGTTKIIRALPTPSRTIVLSLVGSGGAYTVEGVQ